jgi:hypothetical protein
MIREVDRFRARLGAAGIELDNFVTWPLRRCGGGVTTEIQTVEGES